MGEHQQRIAEVVCYIEGLIKNGFGPATRRELATTQAKDIFNLTEADIAEVNTLIEFKKGN